MKGALLRVKVQDHENNCSKSTFHVLTKSRSSSDSSLIYPPPHESPLWKFTSYLHQEHDELLTLHMRNRTFLRYLLHYKGIFALKKKWPVQLCRNSVVLG